MATFVKVELGGGRELVDENRAKHLISEICEIKPTHIRLSNKSFDNDAAKVVASYLDSLDSLMVADISDIIAGRPEELALRTLSIICSSLKKFPLVELNLSDNALGAKGVEACKDVLVNDKLERLYVCNDGLSAEACIMLAQILSVDTSTAATAASSPKLTLLHCYNNMAGDGGAEAMGSIVSACPSLEDFRFSATRSTKSGCMFIAKALGSLRNLKRLDLSDNNFSGKTGVELAKSISSQSSLQYLNLRDDSMGSEVTGKVLQAVCCQSANSLTHLDISGNDVDAESAEEIAELISKFKNLTYLALDDSELGSKGAKLIAATVSSSLLRLKTLSCCTCEITSCGGYYLAKAVSDLPEFMNLELNGNQFTETAIETIKSVLINCDTGKILGEMDDNDEDGDDDLEEALEYFSSTASTNTASTAVATASTTGGQDVQEKDEEDLVAAMQKTALN